MAHFSLVRTQELDAQLRPLIEEQELQQWKVAEKLGVSTSWVERACKRLKLKTQRTGPKSGEEHPDWKGGCILIKGYRFVYAPEHPNKRYGRYMAEHRLVMEQKLGRYLTAKEVVHHKDKNPLNNAPENLKLFASNGEHLKQELTGHVPNWSPEGWEKILKASRERKPTQM